MADPSAYNRIRKRYDDDELIAAAAKVAQTTASPGWALLWDFIDQAEHETLTALFQGHAGASGRVREQADYARLCAYLAGIKEPRTVAEAFQRAAENVHDSPE